MVSKVVIQMIIFPLHSQQFHVKSLLQYSFFQDTPSSTADLADFALGDSCARCCPQLLTRIMAIKVKHPLPSSNRPCHFLGVARLVAAKKRKEFELFSGSMLLYWMVESPIIKLVYLNIQLKLVYLQCGASKRYKLVYNPI